MGKNETTETKFNIKFKRRIFNEKYLPYLPAPYDKKFAEEFGYTKPQGRSRLLVLYGGAGSGKSHFGVQRSVIKLLGEKRKMLVVRKVTATLRDSIFAEFKKCLANFKILHLCKVNESYFSITFPNGSQIIMRGMDDPEKIKSISGIDDIVIEEATELTLDDFTQLNLRMRSKKKNQQILLMYNPTSKSSWCYRLFHDPKEERPEDCIVVHTTYRDNQHLPQEYIDALNEMMKTNPVYYKIYALGEFANLGKTVYENWYVSDFDWRTLIKQGHKAYFGLDFGYVNDPSSFIAIIADQKNKKLYVFDEHYAVGMLNDEIYKMIYGKGFYKEVITGDSAEPKSIEELKRRGIRRLKPARKGNDSIKHGIQFIQQYEIVVHPRCKNFKMELENYTWEKDKKTNEYLNKPVEDFNHLMDAMRYALEDLMPRNRMRSMNKGMFGF